MTGTRDISSLHSSYKLYGIYCLLIRDILVFICGKRTIVTEKAVKQIPPINRRKSPTRNGLKISSTARMNLKNYVIREEKLVVRSVQSFSTIRLNQ
jgi:hypothetical protein